MSQIIFRNIPVPMMKIRVIEKIECLDITSELEDFLKINNIDDDPLSIFPSEEKKKLSEIIENSIKNNIQHIDKILKFSNGKFYHIKISKVTSIIVCNFIFIKTISNHNIL